MQPEDQRSSEEKRHLEVPARAAGQEIAQGGWNLEVPAARPAMEIAALDAGGCREARR